MLTLKVLRIASGKSLFDVGISTGIHPSRISEIERKRIRPRESELFALARALDWPADNAGRLLAWVDEDHIREVLEGRTRGLEGRPAGDPAS
jgi:transcriptional regulator with XRE-family HTH domain